MLLRTRARSLSALVVVPVLLLIVAVGVALGAPRAGAAVEAPPGDTVVEVDGDAANGFHVHHYDGTVDHPPTRSEAQAECAGYDRFRDRVHCHAEVRTWYRDLGVLQQALAYAHAQA